MNFILSSVVGVNIINLRKVNRCFLDTVRPHLQDAFILVASLLDRGPYRIPCRDVFLSRLDLLNDVQNRDGFALESDGLSGSVVVALVDFV